MLSALQVGNFAVGQQQKEFVEMQFMSSTKVGYAHVPS